MDERSKRKITKTRRYISTDEEKYKYKKKKTDSKDILAAFDCIKKAMSENYEEEEEEIYDSDSKMGENSEEEYEPREKDTTEEENIQNHSSLPYKKQNCSNNSLSGKMFNSEHTRQYKNTYRHKEAETLQLQSSENQCNYSCNNFEQHSNNESYTNTAISTSTSVLDDSSVSQIYNSTFNSFESLPGIFIIFYTKI